MKTHLLLSHLENDMHCPLCSLSGVSYDELCFHISSAHPEKQHKVAHFTSSTGCSARTSTGVTEIEKPQTSPKLINATPTSASSVTTDSVPCKQSRRPETGSSSRGERAVITSLLTTQSAVRHSNEDKNGIKSEHNKAKQKQLSLPREGDLTFSNAISNFKATIDFKCAVFFSRETLLLPHVCTGLQQCFHPAGAC